MNYKGFRIIYSFHTNMPIYGMDPECDRTGKVYNCDVFAQEDRLGEHRLHSFHLVDGRDFTTPSNSLFEKTATAFVDKNEEHLNRYKAAVQIEPEVTLIAPEFRKRVVYYCRERSFDHGAAMQLRMSKRTIEEHPNWELVGGYVDHIGTDCIENPDSAFRQLLRDAKAGAFDYVLIDGLTWCQADIRDSLYFIMLLWHWKVHAYSSSEHLDFGLVHHHNLRDLLDIAIPEPTERYPDFRENDNVYP